jgi:2,3-bisphosphoglycerate-independent phosphoglycerate mutase
MSNQSTQKSLTHRPVGLIILDGWGHRDAKDHNAIALANTPNWDRLCQRYPHTLINTSGSVVGLPEGQMGNSEVGHLNLGAGRIVYQEFTRISKAIDDGVFFHNDVLLDTMKSLKKSGKSLHLLALLSDGGVHAHIYHLKAAIKLAADQGVSQIYIHAFTDGRDVAPKSAETYLHDLEKFLQNYSDARIATIVGRYYALDRDHRWDRVEKAYRLICYGDSEHSCTRADIAIEQAYARGETDEFIHPIRIGAKVPIQDGDAIWFVNYRSDRVRQLSRAFIDPDFSDFAIERRPNLDRFVTMTEYHKDFATYFGAKVVFESVALNNTFGEYVSSLGLKQLRIAETEKYAHVTFFMNGGIEVPFPGEERILVPSPKVATYDLQPEMSVAEVADRLCKAIEAGTFDTFICNFANPDMVGHSGVLSACIQAVEAVDEALGRVVATMERVCGEMIVTADHGNIEQLLDPVTCQPHTAHTTNLVPLVVVSDRDLTIISDDGSLPDVMPTMLMMMGLPKPKEMSGQSLIQLN